MATPCLTLNMAQATHIDEPMREAATTLNRKRTVA